MLVSQDSLESRLLAVEEIPHDFRFPEPSASVRRYERIKSLFDVVAASLLVVVFSPLMLLIAAAVKLSSPGPVIFRQRRVGRFGKEFWFYKFRSMTVDAEERRHHMLDHNLHGPDGVTYKRRDDPRVTRIGRLLRKTSLDELPQLWNVLKQDMSLVGPRPALPSEVARYSPEHLQRLAVIPGLTCFWQIQGRSEIPFEKQVRLDLEYIRRRSLWLDIGLILKTVPALISGKGAY